MKLGRPPIGPVLPFAMIGISACPAGSLPRLLHHVRERAQRGLRELFLQRALPQLALNSRSRHPAATEAIRCEAAKPCRGKSLRCRARKRYSRPKPRPRRFRSSSSPALTLSKLSKPAVIAVLLDSNGPAFEAQLQDVRAAARTLGRQIVVVKATSEGEFDTALTTILQVGAGALFVGTSAFFVSQRQKLVIFAAGHALPASYDGRHRHRG
jgi:hypothetical protein